MEAFLQRVRESVAAWRTSGYPDACKETHNILRHILQVGYLHQPQVEALETYIYLKEVLGNQPTINVYKSLFTTDKDLLLGLGVSKTEAFDLIGDQDRINALLTERFGNADYANQVYALTMGAGKTALMAVMIAYDFVLSFYHPDDNRFAKNALVFAPDTIIIESLKEIKTFDYSKVLPREYQNVLLNVKYLYLEDVKTPLTPIGNYNIIVSNSQKIILKTKRAINGQHSLLVDTQLLEKQEVENKRLYAIRHLSNLSVFVDEAHHAYGTTLEGALKKTKQTIDYLHGNTPLVGVINLTGTPYVNNRMIADVMYHFGLKQGIERGILKQVRFFDYSNVRSEAFIDDVIDKFWVEYGEQRLEDKLPKIAFYAASIDDLQSELRPTLERALVRRGIDLDKVLEYHTNAEGNKAAFAALDTPDSPHQFVLLVGKGTEGWNCRSLVSCALYRKPKSSIFVLQSSTRCLRSIGDNATPASIFLSADNYRILDKELRNNFATTIDELAAQDQHSVEHNLRIVKRKKLKVKKVLREIVALESNELDSLRIDWLKYNPKPYQSYVSESRIFLSDSRQAVYKGFEQQIELKAQPRQALTFYDLVSLLNYRTHLPCLTIADILRRSEANIGSLVKRANDDPAILPFIVECLLTSAYTYQEHTEIVEDEIELTKSYPFKISVEQGRNILVVYKDNLEEAEGSSRLGFHIDPYYFDSSDEKNLFKYLRDMLRSDEAICDIYFTGGVADPSHNDFYFEYYSPEHKRIARYFPDLLIETIHGRYLVLEVKKGSDQVTYERNKQDYKGNVEDLYDEVFAKEVGFQQFEAVNKQFEYHIIFDASLQRQQQEVLGLVRDYANEITKSSQR